MARGYESAARRSRRVRQPGGACSGELDSSRYGEPSPCHGPDADAFRTQWTSRTSTLFDDLVGQLTCRAGDVDRHAEEQDQASGPDGSGGSAVSVDGFHHFSVPELETVADGAGRRATVVAASGRVRVLDDGPLGEEASPSDEVQIADVSSPTLLGVIEVMIPRSTEDEDAAGTADDA